jgi:hypothetical protein
MKTDTLSGDATALTTREDLLRARDRLRIQQTRAGGRWLRLIWLLAGPGVLVMLGENDGPSMVSYATTGAAYGVGFFVPFILLTFLMAFVVQEMAVRLGVATERGHAELIFQRFGPFWGYFAMADLVFGNVLTLVTEFIAIQAGGLYFGLPAWLSVLGGVAIVILSLAPRGSARCSHSPPATCCSFPPPCTRIRMAARCCTPSAPGARCRAVSPPPSSPSSSPISAPPSRRG